MKLCKTSGLFLPCVRPISISLQPAKVCSRQPIVERASITVIGPSSRLFFWQTKHSGRVTHLWPCKAVSVSNSTCHLRQNTKPINEPATWDILPPAKLTKIFTPRLKGHSVSAMQVGVHARTRNNNANPTSAPERHGHFQLLKLHIIFQFAPAQNTFEVFAGFLPFMASRAISFGFNKQHTTSILISTPTAFTLFLQSCTAWVHAWRQAEEETSPAIPAMPQIQLHCLPRSGKSTGRRLALLSRGLASWATIPCMDGVNSLWQLAHLAAACKSLQSAANCGESKHHRHWTVISTLFLDKQNTAAGSPTSDLARPFQFQTQLATWGILPPAKLTKIFTNPLKGHSVSAMQVGVHARTRNNNSKKNRKVETLEDYTDTPQDPSRLCPEADWWLLREDGM